MKNKTIYNKFINWQKNNCYLISFKKVKIADSMLYEHDMNDSENYVNVNSLSYGNQQLASIGETPLRNFYKNSKSIPLKQIKLFGNADYEIGGTSGLIYNYDSPINNFSNTSPSYIHQLRQQQNLNYNKYQQANLGLSNSSYFSGPIQYQQLARGLRINSANNYLNNRDDSSMNRAGESSYRSSSNFPIKYTTLPNKG